MVAAGSRAFPLDGDVPPALLVKQRGGLDEVVIQFGRMGVKDHLEVPALGTRGKILRSHLHGHAAGTAALSTQFGGEDAGCEQENDDPGNESSQACAHWACSFVA